MSAVISILPFRDDEIRYLINFALQLHNFSC